MSKVCSKCGVEKSLGEFYTGKAVCKPCHSASGRAWYLANRERANAQRKARYVANRERERAQQAAYSKANAEVLREKQAMWREANRERKRAIRRRHYAENRSAYAANAAARKAAKIERTMTWTDTALVVRIYRIASMATRAFGEQYDVDHVVPLRGRRATGLHTHTNLRVIPARENGRKSNRFDESLAVDRAALARSLAAIILRARAVLEVL